MSATGQHRWMGGAGALLLAVHLAVFAFLPVAHHALLLAAAADQAASGAHESGHAHARGPVHDSSQGRSHDHKGGHDEATCQLCRSADLRFTPAAAPAPVTRVLELRAAAAPATSRSAPRRPALLTQAQPRAPPLPPSA
jgi:hypothetical protein